MKHLHITKSLLLFFSIAATFFLSSCSSNEIGGSSDVNPESIWFDYQVWGEEGHDNMTVMLQYRFAGENGTTLFLDEPSKVEFDGERLKADSSKMTGAYYEIVKPLKDFAGKHEILFTNTDNKQYKEEFSFQPMTMMTPVPDEIERDDLVFELGGLEPKDYVRVLVTDTSFASEEINRIDTVTNGRVLISKKDLETIVTGPVHLVLYKEYEKPVKNGTPEGGRLSFSYALKRDFVLKDSSAVNQVK